MTKLSFFLIIYFLLAYRGDIQTLSDAFKNDTPVDITDKFMKTPLMVGKLITIHLFSLLDKSFDLLQHVLMVI
jgi:ketosteroid isomerase-like protein